MSLIKAKPRKKIRIKEAAAMLGCSSKSIQRGAVGDFRLIKLNNKKTSPYLVFEAEVLEFYEKITADKRF